jgi:hypothetical protein
MFAAVAISLSLGLAASRQESGEKINRIFFITPPLCTLTFLFQRRIRSRFNPVRADSNGAQQPGSPAREVDLTAVPLDRDYLA